MFSLPIPYKRASGLMYNWYHSFLVLNLDGIMNFVQIDGINAIKQKILNMTSKKAKKLASSILAVQLCLFMRWVLKLSEHWHFSCNRFFFRRNWFLTCMFQRLWQYYLGTTTLQFYCKRKRTFKIGWCSDG